MTSQLCAISEPSPPACHYTTFGLHHYLAARRGLIVPVQVGYVRSDDVAWATHSWLQADGRKTDLAIHYPNPPAPSGDLLIDGEVVARGASAGAGPGAHRPSVR